ncbi:MULTISPECIES: MFS transporter [Streptomyces]|uniref:MFS transporter n=1 Tax=unclassified Streptomyces TaxID=2593676 RepID=UPI000F487797|nr:MFS transporter [Streptomyces sp. PanSC9]ROP55822.1 putative MFS family arabinose efflux permease [Streptomyces sp. PanSC9]
MKAYLAILQLRDYRLLWSALVLNLLGDGASYAALAWITLDKAGAAGLGVLGVCLTLPVIVGGAFVGPLLDRFSRRKLFISDSVFRGFVVALVPLLALAGALHVWVLYVVALVYGLLKIIPLAGTPAVLPELVPEDKLQAASGLEATAMGAANVVGPALGALLITAFGAQNVLLLDAATYFAFALLISMIDAPLARPEPTGDAVGEKPGWKPVFRLVTRDRFLLVLTLSFGAFNVSAGALVVALPWLAKDEFHGGPGVLGLMLAVMAAGELIGSLVSGAAKTSEKQMLRIGALQLLSGAVLFLLVPKALPFILIGLVLNGILSAPMTVLGGVVRMTRVPNAMRGRAMTLMRTVMAGALPAGSALGGVLLSGDHYSLLILVVASLAVLPGALTLFLFRNLAFQLGVTAADDQRAQRDSDPDADAVPAGS